MDDAVKSADYADTDGAIRDLETATQTEMCTMKSLEVEVDLDSWSKRFHFVCCFQSWMA